MKRRILFIDPSTQHWHLETLRVGQLEQDPREDYFVLSGETLCQYLLRREPGALVLARGPLPFVSGNKLTVGYLSPLTGVPHYSFVGGRAAAQLLNLGLDAICFQERSAPFPGDPVALPYLVLSGRAPELSVECKSCCELPTGQRSAFYWLSDKELGGDKHAGSIFTLGEGAWLGYRAANLAVDAIYHAGRGGAGAVFARSCSALVLRGEPLSASEFFAGDESSFARNPNAAIAPLLEKHCARLSDKTGGTITKLATTGLAAGQPRERATLPAWNAQRLGYPLADIGARDVLRATRDGQTGCHWCQVDCRHWHWIAADYAPEGRDILLDDFEPAYATFAMLGLLPDQDTRQARLDLLAEVNERLILPIEQMGCDIIDIGLGLAALFEGVAKGIIPGSDAPACLRTGEADRLDAAAQALALLRSGRAADYPALRAVGDGAQALADRYPAMQDIVFTCGKRTLSNAGHCNALWTFLMPLSRFFGHYAGQFYKVDEELPPPGSDPATFRACFERVVHRLLAREFFWLLCNTLSQCAFTFAIYSQDGQGEQLGDDDLLIRLLRHYGMHTTRTDLTWFCQAFWAQSIRMKCRFGWRPPSAADLPARVYEALALALDRPPDQLRMLMDLLIDEWKRQAGAVLTRFGYKPAW